MLGNILDDLTSFIPGVCLLRIVTEYRKRFREFHYHLLSLVKTDTLPLVKFENIQPKQCYFF